MKDELIRLYVEEKKSLEFIAKHLKSNRSAIKKMLTQYEIPIRSHKESCLIFNSDPELRQQKSEDMKGHAHSEETKSKMKKSAKRGKDNVNFIGHFVSPWGTFESLESLFENAPKEHNFTKITLYNWCRKYPEKTINHLHIAHSKYLQSLNISRDSGITFKDLGFDFVTV